MLEILEKHGIVFDWEIYRNCWCVTLYSLRKNEYRVFACFRDRDDRLDLINVVQKRIMIGYNSLGFDSPVTMHLIRNPNISIFDLWQFAQSLIQGDKNPYRFDKNIPYQNLDLMEVIRAGFNSKSLKGVGVNLKFPKILDLPIPFDSEVTVEQFDQLLHYNKNDIDITRAVLDYLQAELEMRQLLGESLELGLGLLTESDSGIGKQVILKKYIELLQQKNPKLNRYEITRGRSPRVEINMSEVISDQIQFTSPELTEYVQSLKEIVLRKPQIKKDLEYAQELQFETAGD